MQFPKSLHASGWLAPLPRPRLHHAGDDLLSPQDRRGLQALAVVMAVTGLAASAGLAAAEDPRPLDVQLGAAMDGTGRLMQQWQAQLDHGLQVSLRAVADGRELRPAAPKTLALLDHTPPPGTEARH